MVVIFLAQTLQFMRIFLANIIIFGVRASQTRPYIFKKWNDKVFFNYPNCSCSKMGGKNCCPVRLAYQPPASSTLLSEQTSHQQPASNTFLSQQTSTSHQPPAKRTDCKQREMLTMLT
jgi:hypothetical protein